MFATIIVLTAVAVGFEILAVNKIPFLLHVLEKYPLAALVFSLFLSVFLGSIFGAAGLIVFVAGLCSTFVVQPYYRMKKRGDIDRIHGKINDAKAKYNAKRDLYARRCHQLMLGLRFVAKVIAAPFVFIGMVLDFIHNVNAKLRSGIR